MNGFVNLGCLIWLALFTAASGDTDTIDLNRDELEAVINELAEIEVKERTAVLESRIMELEAQVTGKNDCCSQPDGITFSRRATEQKRAGQNLTCLACVNAVTPKDCNTVVHCASHEICYMEVHVSDAGIIRYQLGCRDARQCQQVSTGKRENVDSVIPTSEVQYLTRQKNTLLPEANMAKPFGNLTYTSLQFSNNHSSHRGRKRQGLLACTECCSSTLCNSAGCGQNGYTSNKGPICYNCKDQSSPKDCDQIAVCGIDQECMLSMSTAETSHEVRYHTQCQEKQVCRVFESSHIGTLSGCNKPYCCIDDLCNYDCGSPSSAGATTLPQPTKPSTTVTSSTSTMTITMTMINPCASNPCIRGSCSTYLQEFRCTCPTGYRGKQCEYSAVGFTACVSTYDLPHYADGNTIVFDKVISNVGSAYNQYSGTFIAPVKGLYVFILTVMSGNNAHQGLVFSGNRYRFSNYGLADARGRGGSFDTGGSHLAVQLNQSDEVWVETLQAGDTHGNCLTVFSGFLLYEMS